MKEEDITPCDECGTLSGEDGYWLARDGKNYCNYCYGHVFYAKYYGFTKDDFEDKFCLVAKLVEDCTGGLDFELGDLLKLFLLANLLIFFSITTEFLLWVLANSISFYEVL